MKMVCVVFCASLLGTHICCESCLPQSSTQALPKDAKWQSIQISPPSGDGVDQIPKDGEQKSIKCPTYAQPPPPGINIDRYFTKSLVFPRSSNKVYRKGTTEHGCKFPSEHRAPLGDPL
jgi:hypothetical protein